MIGIKHIKNDAVFKDTDGNLYHILKHSIIERWNKPTGYVYYNFIGNDNVIHSKRSTIELFSKKFSQLNPAVRSELADKYNSFL